MDPSKFPVSRIPLKHEPYGPILLQKLKGANRGKVAVVTGAGRGMLLLCHFILKRLIFGILGHDDAAAREVRLSKREREGRKRVVALMKAMLTAFPPRRDRPSHCRRTCELWCRPRDPRSQVGESERNENEV